MPSNTNSPSTSLTRRRARRESPHPPVLTPGVARTQPVHGETLTGQTPRRAYGRRIGSPSVPVDSRERLPSRNRMRPQRRPRTPAEDGPSNNNTESIRVDGADIEGIPQNNRLELPKHDTKRKRFSWEPILRPGFNEEDMTGEDEHTPPPQTTEIQNQRSGQSDEPRGTALQETVEIDNRPEHVQVFDEMQSLVCSLCFSNAFIDRIPSRPSWFGFEYGVRRAFGIVSGDERGFWSQVVADMYRFYDSVSNDFLVINRTPEGRNVALRWNLTKFIWGALREQVLEFEGDFWAEEVKNRAVEYIQSVIRPFAQSETNPDQYRHWILCLVKLAIRLRSLLELGPDTWYEFKLPPNLDGTCIGNGTKEHVQYVSLDGTGHDGMRVIYGVVYGPLVKYVRGRDCRLSVSVECPALVADYCPAT